MSFVDGCRRSGYNDPVMAISVEAAKKKAKEYVVDEHGQRVAVIVPIDAFFIAAKRTELLTLTPSPRHAGPCR